jgi:hypothetical protein
MTDSPILQANPPAPQPAPAPAAQPQPQPQPQPATAPAPAAAPATASPTASPTPGASWTPSGKDLTLEQLGQAIKKQYPTYANYQKYGDAFLGMVAASKNPTHAATLATDQFKRIPTNIDAHIQILNQAMDEQANPPAQTPLDSPITSVAKTAAGFPANVAKSGWSFLKGVGTMIAHPIQTGKNLASVAAGGVETAATLGNANTPQTAAFKTAVQKMIVDRYGSPEKAAETIYNDPVGFLADFSTLAGGAEGLSKLVSGASDVSKAADAARVAEGADAAAGGAGDASKVADVAGDVSTKTNPINIAAKGVKAAAAPVTKAAKWVGAQAIGKLSGAGIDNVQDFARIMRSGTDEERAAATEMMRNNSAFTDTYKSIQGAATALKSVRGENYAKALEDLQNTTAGAKAMDVSPLLGKTQSLLKDFNIKMNPDGTLDFSLAGIKDADKADIQKAVDLVQKRLEIKGGRTMTGLDSLKQDLNNLSQGLSPKAAGFVKQLAATTKGIVVKNVPGYSEMEADYASKSALLDQLGKEFSPNSLEGAAGMAGRGKFTTGVKKIISLAKTDNSFQRDLLEQLQTETGGDKQLIAKLSGAAFSPILSEGGIGKLAEGFGVVTAFFNPSEMIHLGALFTVTSPRVMGEFLNALGYSGKAVDAFNTFMKSDAGSAFQDLIVKQGTAAERVNQSQQ